MAAAEPNYKSINQLLRTDNEINDMIAFINSNRTNYPANVVQNRYLIKSNKFYVANRNTLMFVNPNREFVRKQDINNRLSILYNDKATGLNKSIQTFYYLIQSRYFNVTRKECEQFLKSQQIYNLSRPAKPAQAYSLPTYKRPKQAFAMDYIHVTNIYRKPGQAELYILTIVDVFSKFIFLFACNNNRDDTTIRCLTSLIHNNNNIPNVIIADNGFKLAIKNFLLQHNIKLLNNPSHIPVKFVESANRTVRRYLRELVLRNYQNPNTRWNWANEINTIAQAINNTKSSTTGKTPNELYYGQNQNVMDAVVDKVNAQKQGKLRPNRNDTIFQVNQPVHVLLTTAYRDLRKQAKEDDLKNVAARWSAEIYFVHKIYHARNRNGLPLYSLRNAQNLILHTDQYHHQNPRILKLKSTDLLDATHETNIIYNNQDVLRINKIDRPQANPLQFQ